MSVKNIGGSDVFTQPVTFSDRKTSKKEVQQAGKASWSKGKTNLLVVIIVTLLDGVVLFSIFDDIFTQNVLMSILMTAGVAAVLDTTPVIMSYYTHLMIDKTYRYANVIVAVLLAGFILLYGCTVYLRFSYSSNYDKQNDSNTLENTVTVESEDYSESENGGSGGSGGVAVMLLFSVSPLITSMLSFAISFISVDPNRQRLEELEIKAIENDEKIAETQTAITQIETMVREGKELELETDKEAMDKAKDEIIRQRAILKSSARLYLEEFLANASATSRISAEMIADESEFAQSESSNVGEGFGSSIINMNAESQAS